MIKQGGVRIDGARIEDQKQLIQAGATYTLQVGKRKFAKTTIKSVHSNSEMSLKG